MHNRRRTAGDDHHPSRRRGTYRKSKPVFTYCGVALGILISILVVYKAKKAQEDVRVEVLELKEINQEEARKDILKGRQVRDAFEKFKENNELAGSHLQKILARTDLTPRVKLNALQDALQTLCHTPNGISMANEVLNIQYTLSAAEPSNLRVRPRDREPRK